MRICFMGTPAFAAVTLRALVEAGCEVVLAVTQPDRPKNRGMKLIPTPVKEYALTESIPVYQPKGLRNPDALARIQAAHPDLIVVVAYGRILPPSILTLPRFGCVNLHASLLPKYRGAAPIQWAILNGEAETGVAVMQMAEGLDTGDVLATVRTPIGADETAGELHDRLASLGARLLTETLPRIAAGQVTPVPQDDAKATVAPLLTRALSAVDWTRPAAEIHNQIRGLNPWPAAVAELGGVRCKMLASRVLPMRSDKPAGSICYADKRGLAVTCGGGTVLELLQVQPDGKKAMPAADFLRGNPRVEDVR